MKQIFIFLVTLFSLTPTVYSQNAPLRLGVERVDVVARLLRDKRVGLVVSQTSVLEKRQTHLLGAPVAEGIDVKKVFIPEYGFRGTGDAGEEIKDSRDLKTGIPIISIYGKNKKSSTKQLGDLDMIVFDIQGVSARFYIYISTMHYVMEACAEDNKEFIVLDRPDPNNFVDGPIRQKGLESFVGIDPLPILHDLTVGELAWIINKEGWLKNTPDTCRLKIVKMENWRHEDPYWLPVKPSPNLPNDQFICLYPSLCFFETTNVSVGRGTYYPFQILGFPDPRYGNSTFTPASLPGFDTNPLQEDRVCYSTDLREYPFEGGLTLRFFLDFYNKAGKDQAFFLSRPNWFDLLAGMKQFRYQVVKGLSEKEIRESWKPELDQYKAMRKKYLLHPDYPIQNRK